MKIVIIGSGNVATVLGRKIKAAGHALLQVMSRHEEHAIMLAVELNCSYTSTWEDIDAGAEMYVVAISDSSLPELDKKLNLHNKLVVHTAGAVSKSVLKNVSRNYGVMYPLQSLRKEIAEMPEIPLLVDGNTEDALALIQDFALSLSGEVQVADDATRLKLHVAAVLVNNFTSHLYALAEAYCRKEQIDFRLLLPLIGETAERIRFFTAGQLQTGPAIRNDAATIARHLGQLEAYPGIREVYEVLTKSIQNAGLIPFNHSGKEV